MKFSPKEDFRIGRQLFEAGNTYESGKYGVSDARATQFVEDGWADVEGVGEAKERKPGASTIVIGEDTTHG